MKTLTTLLFFCLACSLPAQTVTSVGIDWQNNAHSYNQVIVNGNTTINPVFKSSPTSGVGHTAGTNNANTGMVGTSQNGGDDWANSQAYTQTNVTAGSSVMVGYLQTTKFGLKSSNSYAGSRATGMAYAQNSIKITGSRSRYRSRWTATLSAISPNGSQSTYGNAITLLVDATNAVQASWDNTTKKWIITGKRQTSGGSTIDINETVSGNLSKTYTFYVFKDNNEVFTPRADLNDLAGGVWLVVGQFMEGQIPQLPASGQMTTSASGTLTRHEIVGL